MAALAQRQLPNLLSGIFPFGHHTETSDPTRSAGLTTSENVSPSNLVTSTTSVISLTSASSSSSSSQSSLSSSLSSTVASATSVTSSSVIPSSTVISVVPTTSTDDTTTYVTVAPTPTPSIQSAPANSAGSFLQNKTLSGIVFAVVGVVVLVLLVAIATIALRRSRKKRLHKEAVSFDPTSLGGSQLDRDSTEKRRFSLLSSDNGHGFGSNLGAYTPTTAPAETRQGLYRYPGSESQHSLIGQHSQQPLYGGALNTTYGSTHPQSSSTRPAWMYGNDPTLVQPSKAPTPSDRAYTPDITYLQGGNFKVANA